MSSSNGSPISANVVKRSKNGSDVGRNSPWSVIPLSAQLNTGRISGQIADQSGGAIAGAKVTVIDVARGENRVPDYGLIRAICRS